MLLAIPLILLAAALFWGWYSSSVVLRQPRLVNEFNPKSFGRDYEKFKVITDDNVELAGWFVPAQSRSSEARATVIVNHGWGANRSDVLGASIFLSQKFNLVYFDFRGHGDSGGDVTSLGCLEVRDFQTVARHVKSRKKEFAERLGVLGFSMGGAAAITAAAENPDVSAVVAESSFSSYKEVVYRYGTLFFNAPRFLIPVTLLFTQARLGFDPDFCSPVYHIGKIAPRPVLLIQGDSDERMPIAEGEALLAAANEPKELWVVQGADHIGAKEINPAEYEAKISRFFETHLLKGAD